MRILILADACNPDWPSLPSFGYRFALAISNYADVVVATQIRNWRNIEREGMGKAEVVYLDTEKVAAPLYKLAVALRGSTQTGWNIQTVMNYPSYLAFEWFAWKRFQKDLCNKNYDVVHRITPVSPFLPSFMVRHCPVPFLLGPINGHLPLPNQVKTVKDREMGRGDRFAGFLLRSYRRFPFYKSTYMRAAGILACFEHTIAGLPAFVKSKTINFPEVGLDPKLFTVLRQRQRRQMTVIFVGRLVPYKMPDVLLQAFANSDVLRQHKLMIVGDGPERSNLERFVLERDLGRCVEFKGQKSQAEVGQLMCQADIFAFPSIHELGGGVVVEAMACGLACVVVDYGGPATLVADDCGIKVPMGTVNYLTEQVRHELEQLVRDPDRAQRLGDSANKHAMTYYAWDAKARKTLEIYRWLVGQQKQKPDFWDQSAAS